MSPAALAEVTYRDHFCRLASSSSALAAQKISCLAHNFFMVHDPDTTLNFDLKVKFIQFLTCVRPTFFFGLKLAYHVWDKGVST